MLSELVNRRLDALPPDAEGHPHPHPRPRTASPSLSPDAEGGAGARHHGAVCKAAEVAAVYVQGQRALLREAAQALARMEAALTEDSSQHEARLEGHEARVEGHEAEGQRAAKRCKGGGT